MNINLIKKTLFMILLCPVLVSGVNVTFNVDMSQEDVGNEGPTLWMGFFWPEPGFVMTDDDQDGVWSYTVDNLNPGTYTYKYRNGWWTDWDTGSGWEDLSGQDCAVGQWSDREVVVGGADMVVDACFGFCMDGFCGEVETDCSDGIDNDGDGFTDCDDSNCADDPDCIDDDAWVLVWSDEFNGPEIDENKWSYDIGTGDWGWGNGEAQYYTSNSNNSFIEDGKLIIQALLQNYGGANYTSARMVTRGQGDWTYGRIEVRATLPGGVGTWPAIWMLPTDWVYGGWPSSGEIDIMEHVGFDLNVIHGTAHTEAYNWWNGSPPPEGTIYLNGATSSFHDYALEWDEDYLKWYVDDINYFTFANDQSGNHATWPFDQRFHLLLNIAIGGTWGGQQGIDNSIFPVRLEVDYVRVYQPDEAVNVTVTHNEGWNLVGLPVNVTDGSLTAIYPDATGGTLYSYDGAYVDEDTLIPGEGYWLHFQDAGTTTMGDTPINSITMTLTEGWNLISGISTFVPIENILDPLGIVIEGTLYGFEGSYEDAYSIEPGKGYWINASADGYITISSGGSAKTISTFKDRTEKANKLSFNSSDLYFGVSIPEEEMLSYQLPPKPPAGAFDVRFADNMKVTDNTGAIEITSNFDQLVITYDIKDDADWILAGDEEYRISGSGEIIVFGNITGLTLNKVTEMPMAYSVSQNYPNPFNPTTTIRYDLPEHSHVSIMIYDLMGRRVTTLVNEPEEPGYKSVVWDGTDSFGKPISAGLYLYQIRAGNFTRVHKMALLK